MMSPRARAFLSEEDLPAWSEPPEPESVGVDFLGLRPVNLSMLAELTEGFNNVATSARQHTILAWAAWRFHNNLREAGRTAAKRQEFSDFLEAVETIQLVGQEALSGDIGDAPMLGRFSLPRLRKTERIPLQFAAYGRTHETSAMAAVNYGPSAKPSGLGLIRGKDGIWVATSERGEALAVALDPLLRRSRAYRHLERVAPPKTMEYAEAVDLARSGLVVGPKLEPRPEREAYTAALFDLDDAQGPNSAHDRRRSLALFVELLRYAGKAGLSGQDLRRALLAGRFPRKRFALPTFLQDTADRWRILQARQLQRYVFETWLALAETWMQQGEWNVSSMVDSLSSHLSDSTDSPVGVLKSMLKESAAAAMDHFVVSVGLEDVSEWAASNRPGGPWNLLEEIGNILWDRDRLPYAAAPAALALTMSVVKLAETVVPGDGPIRDFAAQGDRRRISLVFFADWWCRRSTLPLAQVLGELVEELVLQQHVAVAVSRFDNEKRRLRFCNDERGWELLPGTERSTPNLTPDRIDALLMLLNDLGILKQVCPGSYLLAEPGGLALRDQVARLYAD